MIHSMHYNKKFHWPISKQYFDDVIHISQSVSWIFHVHKPQISLNNDCFLALSIRYNEYFNWPISRQYFNDIIYISQCQLIFFISIKPQIWLNNHYFVYLRYVTMNILSDQSPNSILMTAYIFLSASVEFFMSKKPKYV